MPGPAVVPLLELVRRGATREQILAFYRDSLRDLVDPETGQPVGEEEIRRATMTGGRFWVEAEGDDVLVQGMQHRAEFLAEQIDPRRSATSYLEEFHGPAAKLPRLLQEGASGFVTVTAPAGSVFAGYPNVPNELATRGQDAAGLLYQVILSATSPGTGVPFNVLVKGIDGGRETNLEVGAAINWINAPNGSSPGAVSTGLTGGVTRETDAEWGERLFDAKGSRPKAGNAAHFRLWARRASTAVDRAYVYPNGLGSGSVLAAVLQKRGSAKGPSARVPSAGLMTVVTGYLTPPVSSVVPGQAFVVVVPCRPYETSGTLLLGLKFGVAAGWADTSPWPRRETQDAVILSSPAPTQTTFTMSGEGDLPSSGPQMMVWNELTSEFELLAVSSVVASGADYAVTLSAPHSGTTLVAGAKVSPYTKRAASIARGVVAYFDSLGPGELVLQTSVELATVHRRPSALDVEPYEAGDRIVSFVSQAMGGSIERGSVVLSSEEPPNPLFDRQAGPFFLVPSRFAVYPA